MNKKQLSLQNASLFAELERKAKEMEILSIRLEDADKKIGELNTENEELKNFIEQIKSENDELKAEIEELKKNLAEAESKAEQTFAVQTAVEPEIPYKDEENSNIETVAEEAKNIAEEIFEKFYSESSETITNNTENSNISADIAEQTADDITQATEATQETVANNEETILTHANSPAPPVVFETTDFANKQEVKSETEKSVPATDLLRDYGARIIGKVTRVTAEVLSKIGSVNDDVSESLKTLALGKNESFKFQIMELAKGKEEPEKLMQEMDFLANEAIVYLRSI